MIVKVTLAFAIALLLVVCARRAAAATRHAILSAAQAVALILPLLGAFVPVVKVEVPAAINARRAHVPAAPVRDVEVIAMQPSHLDLSLLWAIGVAVVASIRLVSYIRAANIVRRARGHRFTDAIQQPMTFGSRILLPHEAETWDDARLEAVLLHERAHVERRDSLLGLLSDITCAVYWFHPLAWIAARRSMLERERACDEAVLASHIAPTAYATTLLDVARGRALGIAMADRSHLETRIRAILDPTIRRRMTRVSRVMVVGGALVAAPLLAALTPRGIEPDLLGDSIASPFSERIGVDDIPNVSATGPDAALIAQLQDFARRPPQSEIDFVGDRARWALHQVRNGELVTPLLDMLDHHDWRVRAYAAFILGYGRDTRATAPLTAALRDPIWRVRASASSALEHLADPAAAPAMRAALDDDAWQVRVCAVHYFTNIGASRELFESMKTDRHIAVRMAAEEALQ